MLTSKLGRLAAVVATVLVVGAGVAVAEEAIVGDEIVDDTTTTTVDDTTTTTVEDETTTTTEESESEEEESESEGDEGAEDEGTEVENHGQIVSEAARDHSNDERCGNHGAWVSSVARGLEDCIAVDDDGEDAEGEAPVVEPAPAPGNSGNAPGRTGGAGGGGGAPGGPGANGRGGRG